MFASGVNLRGTYLEFRLYGLVRKYFLHVLVTVFNTLHTNCLIIWPLIQRSRSTKGLDCNVGADNCDGNHILQLIRFAR